MNRWWAYRSAALVGLVVLAIGIGIPVGSQQASADSKASEGQAEGRDEVDKAVDLAIAYLLKHQDEEGWIHHDRRRKENRTVMTSLSLLAMAAVGHQPTDPTTEGKAMRRALEYVLESERTDRNGYYGGPDGSRMYGHGITTLMLAEMLGMGVDDEMDELIRRRLEKAIKLTLDAQVHRGKQDRYYGGWRYEPSSRDADLSLTVWQLMSLRSAKNAGLEVPKEAIDDAIDYLRRSYDSKRDSKGRPTNLRSGFTYQPHSRDVEFSSTSMGLLAMQVCGRYDALEVAGAANWLEGRRLDPKSRYFLYGLYYYAQGMYQYGERLKREGKVEEGTRFAEQAQKSVTELLTKHQRKDGAWEGWYGGERNAGPIYCTTMAILSLSVKYHYLPIYQG